MSWRQWYLPYLFQPEIQYLLFLIQALLPKPLIFRAAVPPGIKRVPNILDWIPNKLD